MKTDSSRQRIAMAVLAAALFLPLALAAGYVMNKQTWARDKLAEIEPRHARLRGMEASKGELDAALAQTAAVAGYFVYPASKDASQTGNEVQQRVRELVTSAGLSISSSQVLPPKTEKQFDRISLALRMDGELPAVHAALVAISTQSPAIHFESMTVNTVGAVTADVPQRLSIQFNLFVLRARS